MSVNDRWVTVWFLGKKKRTKPLSPFFLFTDGVIGFFSLEYFFKTISICVSHQRVSQLHQHLAREDRHIQEPRLPNKALFTWHASVSEALRRKHPLLHIDTPLFWTGIGEDRKSCVVLCARLNFLPRASAINKKIMTSLVSSLRHLKEYIYFDGAL